MSLIGRAVKRIEDRRFVTGRGEYVDDVPLPDALHVAIVRSTYAHALIRAIDRSEALDQEGVVAVVTAADLGSTNGPHPHPTWFPPHPPLQAAVRPFTRPERIWLLAADRVRFVGEPVAAVVATDRYLAEDAARLVAVDYEPLPVVPDAERGLAPDAPLINPEWGDNVAARFAISAGDVDAAFARAARVVRRRLRYARAICTPIEPRGVAARPGRSGDLTVWSSTQQPHWLRDALERILRRPGDTIRVVAPDVGGGFGLKSMVYPEELLVPWLALHLGRAVKWIETRRENLQSATHARDQVHDIELALAADGTILGLRDRYIVDTGCASVENIVCAYNTAAHLPGAYRIPALAIECTVGLSNKAPLAAERGAGRPEAAFALEGILDAAADELGIDPAELRLRNALRGDEMPHDHGILYRDGAPLRLDAGDYRESIAEALRILEYDRWRAEQGRARREGRLIGIGMAGYIEGTGVPPYEAASVRVDPSGRVVVTVGPPSQGQGHETTLAQIAAEVLSVPIGFVRVVQGDTYAFPSGGGTIASRIIVVVGNAVAAAATELRRKILLAAEDILEVGASDLDIVEGRVVVRGSPERGISLAALAARVTPGIGRLGSAGPGLEARGAFQPPTVTFGSGFHAAVVEVDPDSGLVTILRYVVVHDCGRIVNPAIVDGQVVGGIAQGIGHGLFEELVYDETGQLLTGTFTDYLLPRATDLPTPTVVHRETPSERNPLGVKGVGEAGTVPGAALVLGAVRDALGPAGRSLDTVPVTPARILAALEARRAVGVG
ncbi:MAG TPA: xanthine dehydrogenase family protein molybdopterin-binding subunit [Candidatus Limnocylindrales bacterium]|nr:xanthine dehydrogenase family protein molybdopterin-binding subunit [Candidatus Limnocylindrales bacterium]